MAVKKRILYTNTLPVKGKGKLNRYKEIRNKQQFKRNILESKIEYQNFEHKFDHLEDDTIIGTHHKSAIVILVE